MSNDKLMDSNMNFDPKFLYDYYFDNKEKLKNLKSHSFHDKVITWNGVFTQDLSNYYVACLKCNTLYKLSNFIRTDKEILSCKQTTMKRALE